MRNNVAAKEEIKKKIILNHIISLYNNVDTDIKQKIVFQDSITENPFQ